MAESEATPITATLMVLGASAFGAAAEAVGAGFGAAVVAVAAALGDAAGAAGLVGGAVVVAGAGAAGAQATTRTTVIARNDAARTPRNGLFTAFLLANEMHIR